MGAGTFLSRRRFWEIRQLQGGADSRPPFSSLPSVPAWSQARLSSLCPQGGPLQTAPPPSDHVFHLQTLRSSPSNLLPPSPSNSLLLPQSGSPHLVFLRLPQTVSPPSDLLPLSQTLLPQTFILSLSLSPPPSDLLSLPSPPPLDHLFLSDLFSSFRASSLRLYPSSILRLRTPSTLSLSALPNPLWAKRRHRPPPPSPVLPRPKAIAPPAIGRQGVGGTWVSFQPYLLGSPP